jgi:hypothetical protein
MIRKTQKDLQFPHSDYPGLLLDLASDLNLLPPLETLKENRIVVPSLFNSKNRDLVNQQIKQLCDDLKKGKGISKNILSSVENHSYSFQRTITNYLDENSVTTVNGTVSFQRIPFMPLSDEKIHSLISSCSVPTTDKTTERNEQSKQGSSDGLVLEDIRVVDDRLFLLYKEEGKLSLPNGQSFDVSQNYIYYYNSFNDCMEIFFCHRDNPSIIDYHFLTLKFEKKEVNKNNDNNNNDNNNNDKTENADKTDTKEQENGWIGKNDHLCINDLYKANYLFQFQGLELPDIMIDFHVKGPKKDYLSSTKLQLLT